MVQRHLPDGVNPRVGRPQAIVHHHTAARADGEPGGSRQLVARADPARYQHQVRRHTRAVGKLHRFHTRLPENRLVGCADMHVHSQGKDLFLQQTGSRLVQLARHQPGCHFYHPGVQAQIDDCLCCFEAEKPPADDHRSAAPLCVRENALQVIDGAVQEHAGELRARHRRHEREGTGGENERIPGHASPRLRLHSAVSSVDAHHPLARTQVHAALAVELRLGQPQPCGIAMSEKLRQPDTVVRRSRFFAEHDHSPALSAIPVPQCLAKSVADHAMADDH